ncbi:hypothetical protein [Robertmurraya sp. FSL R5-0851]
MEFRQAAVFFVDQLTGQVTGRRIVEYNYRIFKWNDEDYELLINDS